MPFIHFINSNEEVVEMFLDEKLEEFSKLSKATTENIYIISNNSKIVNRESASYIKIEWMPREKEVEEAVVNLLNDFLLANGYERSAVYFINIDKEHYYTGNLV